jgi:phage gp36-like protein
MPFINKSDYFKQIKEEVFDQIIEDSNQIRLDAELAGQSEMESYLRDRFDVAQIFNKTGAARHPLILLYLIDIVLYHIHSRINPINIPDIRQVRYDNAIEWLKKVSKGEISPDLPTKEDEEGNTATLWKMGSNKKFNSEY